MAVNKSEPPRQEKRCRLLVGWLPLSHCPSKACEPQGLEADRLDDTSCRDRMGTSDHWQENAGRHTQSLRQMWRAPRSLVWSAPRTTSDVWLDSVSRKSHARHWSLSLGSVKSSSSCSEASPSLGPFRLLAFYCITPSGVCVCLEVDRENGARPVGICFSPDWPLSLGPG